MILENNLDLFLVQVSIEGYTEVEIQQDLNDFFDDLKSRDYLINPQVWYDAEVGEIRIDVTTEASSSQSASLMVYDDIFEAVVANINFSSENGIKVKILNTEKQE